MEDCLFCKIAAGEIPSSIVYQDEQIVAFRDIDPKAPQHILIVSRRHIGSMNELTAEDAQLLMHIFMTTQRVAHELGLAKGYRFLTNVGSEGGQSIPHLHFHLLGGRELGWTPG
jgi:histidine triad (HIT) family protein